MAAKGGRRQVRAQKIIYDISPGPADVEFRDRSPELIHQDPRLPEQLPSRLLTARNWNWTPEQQATIEERATQPPASSQAFRDGLKALLAQLQKVYEQLSALPEYNREHDRELLSLLSVRVLLMHGRPFSNPVLRRLRHIAVAQAVDQDGPEKAFSNPAVRWHLEGVMQLARSAPTMEQRKAAKDAWRAIFDYPMPNLRQFKEPRAGSVEGAALAAAITSTRKLVRGLHNGKWKSPARLMEQLRAAFPGVNQRAIRRLAEGIDADDPDEIRAGINDVVGDRFGLGHTGVRDAIARHRRNSEKHRFAERVALGQARYLSWLDTRTTK